MTINWQWQLNLCNGSLQLCAESLSNLNTVSLHVNTTDYTNVNILFLFFFSSLILFLTLCLTSSLSFSLSLSHLCASDLHFLSVSELCHTCIFTVAFLQQRSLPRRWASGWRVCPPMALCRQGKIGKPSSAIRTTKRYRSTSLISRTHCKTSVFEILYCWRMSHSDHIQLLILVLYVSCVFLIAKFGQIEVILHNLNKVQYTVWISVCYILHFAQMYD